MGYLPYTDFISVNIVVLEALSGSCIISRYGGLILLAGVFSDTASS